MEQHMYNFLNKKYGLKNLVADWAGSIIASVKRYSIEDNDVSVFGLILKNEIEEEFRFIQVQLKKTVNELLKVNLRNKFPLKSNSDILEMMTEKTNGFLNEDEWVEIIRFMYNEQDSNEIIEEIYQLRPESSFSYEIQNKNRISREEATMLKEKERAMKNRIGYNELVNSLLDFQMRGHQKYLEKFVYLFHSVDTNNDGVLSEKDFRKLIQSLNLNFKDDDCIRMLQVLDPFDNQQITFSECVSLFNNELVPGTSHSVMERLSVED
jgi:Ca2+-binding EF-hand superfamily protein